MAEPRTRRDRSVLAMIALAVTAAAWRLLPLGWLHPLNYDELEFYQATEWVRRGLVPFVDFWEHHAPLQWFVFAPFAALTSSEGAAAVLWMRWMQVPLWIATFWLANVWMRRLGLERFARWAALATVLGASFLMIPAVEYRVDVLAIALYLAGFVLAMRMQERRALAFASGVAFFLAGFANVRIGPLLALTVLLVCWKERGRAVWMLAGIATAAAVCLGGYAAIGGLDDLYRQVWVDNYLNDAYAKVGERQFRHRLLVVFGVHILGTRWLFDPATIDPGGIALLVLGTLGLVRVFRGWRERSWWQLAAVLQVASVVFVARMKHVYNYHFEIVAVMMLPFVALELGRLRRREAAFAIAIAAWCVAAFASVFRGKELDLAYQDLIMREVHQRTQPQEKVFQGAAWAIRRPPAYRYWFLPGLVTELVGHGHGEPYRMSDVLRDPPAAIISDYAMLKWLGREPELRRFVVRHYLPVWRNLWIPAPNARLVPGSGIEWVVLRDGDYRVIASEELAGHPWFRVPVFVSPLDRPDAKQLELTLPQPGIPDGLELSVAAPDGRVRLKKGQRIAARWNGGRPIGVLLVPGNDAKLFRQPLAGVTLEAAYPRFTHLPQPGLRLVDAR